MSMQISLTCNKIKYPKLFRLDLAGVKTRMKTIRDDRSHFSSNYVSFSHLISNI